MVLCMWYSSLQYCSLCNKCDGSTCSHTCKTLPLMKNIISQFSTTTTFNHATIKSSSETYKPIQALGILPGSSRNWRIHSAVTVKPQAPFGIGYTLYRFLFTALKSDTHLTFPTDHQIILQTFNPPSSNTSNFASCFAMSSLCSSIKSLRAHMIPTSSLHLLNVSNNSPTVTSYGPSDG